MLASCRLGLPLPQAPELAVPNVDFVDHLKNRDKSYQSNHGKQNARTENSFIGVENGFGKGEPSNSDYYYKQNDSAKKKILF